MPAEPPTNPPTNPNAPTPNAPTGDQYRTSLRTAADWGLVALAVIAVAALTQPLGSRDGMALTWTGEPLAFMFLLGSALAVVAGRTAPSRVKGAWAELGGAALAWLLPFHLLSSGADLSQGWGLWLYLLAAALMQWRVLRILAGVPGTLRRVVVPGLSVLGLLLGWEVLVRGFGVPSTLLPPPSAIAASLL
ncbi:hypothetical protein [Azospirillum sp. sgz302134]